LAREFVKTNHVALALHEGGFTADDDVYRVDWRGVPALVLDEGFKQPILAFLGRDATERQDNSGVSWDVQF
jgi:hypothetical protein